MSEIIEADLTWIDGRFQRGIRVETGDDGRIVAAGSINRAPTRRLERQALVPGFVNAHSHAFQRGLRGYGEKYPGGAGSFWSWREAMYGLVERLDAEQLYDISRKTYEEMLRAGITTVGEFHYLHHSRDGAASGAQDHALDEAVIRAAADAGIRLVLLFTYYRTGGFQKALTPAQRRFETTDPASYWQALDRAAARLDSATQTIGAVAHSIRAASPDEIAELYREARRRGLVFHMHVEEQKLELLECEAAYGQRPMRLLLDRIESLEGFTGVHCTHTSREDLEELLARGGSVCVTPLTEASLGDGVPQSEPLRRKGGSVSLGTDSNARISMLEEMRWLEYAQRLRFEARGMLADANGAVGRPLLDVATAGGARSLGVGAGEIAAGKLADFVTIRLDATSIAGAPDESLEDAIVFSGGDDVIGDVCVNGRWRAER